MVPRCVTIDLKGQLVVESRRGVEPQLGLGDDDVHAPLEHLLIAPEGVAPQLGDGDVDVREVVGVEHDALQIALRVADAHRVRERLAHGQLPPPRSTNPRGLKLRQRVLEAREIPGQQRVDRPPGRTGRPHPALQDGPAGLLRGLARRSSEDRKLGPMLELAREQREGVDVEHLAELVLAQAEQLHQPRGLLATRRHSSDRSYGYALSTSGGQRSRVRGGASLSSRIPRRS